MPDKSAHSAQAQLLQQAQDAVQSGNGDKAAHLLEHIIKQDQAHFAALSLLLDVLYHKAEFDKLEQYLQDGIKAAPQDLRLRILLAQYFLWREYDLRAHDVLQYVLAHQNRNLQALLLLTQCLGRMQRLDEAHAHARLIFRLYGMRLEFLPYVIGTLSACCDLQNLSRFEKLLEEENLHLAPHNLRLLPQDFIFYLRYGINTEGLAQIRQIADSWQKRVRHHVRSIGKMIGGKKRRITRLGFVSQDFFDHPVGRFFQSLPLALSMGLLPDMEIYCYNSAPERAQDKVHKSIKQNATMFRPLHGRSSAEIAEIIRKDEVDILFDLGGHSARSLSWLFALRLAPIQVMWLGWGHTGGAPEIDYVLADSYCTPQSAEMMLEKPWILDCPYMVYAGNVPGVSALPAFVENGHVTFGQPNRIDKWTAESMDRDSAVLRAVPNAKLLVFRPELHNKVLGHHIFQEFSRRGIAPSRITLAENTPQDYAAYFARCDLVLDPHPVCGGATTMDSLLHGVPVLTQSGEMIFSRFSHSFLNYAGLAELSAENRKDFIEKAVALAENPDKILIHRRHLSGFLSNSPLCDIAGQALAWRKACAALLA